MAYGIQKDEPVDESVRRVVRDLTRESLEQTQSDQPAPERVHEIRKALKRVRAVLRIVRGSLDDYSERNRRYRDIGRMLSDTRDAGARIETIDAIEERLVSRVGQEVTDALRSGLEKSHSEALDDVEGELAAVAEELRSALADADSNPIELDSTAFEAIAGGLAKTYRRGRDLCEEAHVDASVETFHTWRKRAKYHRHHIDFLENLWQPVLTEWEDAMHDLTDELGLDHDVAVLEEFVVAHPELLADAVVTQKLRAELKLISAEHRERALLLGERAFAETPTALVQRYRRYWEVWRES